MRAKIYTSFDELPESYRKFFAEIEGKNFFVSINWFKNFADTALELHHGIRIYAIEDDDANARPRGVLVTRTPAGQNGSILSGKLNRGRTLASMTNYQSVFFSPLLSENEPDTEAVVGALASAVCSDSPPWTLIDLNLMDPDSLEFEPLVAALRASGMLVCRYRYAEMRYERMANRNFEQYLAARPSLVRKTYLRKARNLRKIGRERFDMVCGESNLESAILDYQKVLANSWKEPEPYPKFTAGLVRVSARAGVLRLGILYIDDQPVAAQLWLVSGGNATIYKLHYDLKFQKYSVGSTLTLRMLEYVIDVDRVDEVNFGVGNEPHKRNWLLQERSVQGILAFNPRTFRGLLALVRHIIVSTIKLAYRRLKPALRPCLDSLKHLADPKKK